MISAAQIKAGRAMLAIKQSDLAKAAGISLATLNNLERGIGDPRASTLGAIERALFVAGVETDSDGVSEIVRLNKLARPNAYDTLHASQKVLECLSRDSLLHVARVRFFVRADHHAPEGADALRLCLAVDGAARTIVFDQVRFSLAGGTGAAVAGGVLLAAFALHRGALFYLPTPIEDTTLSSLEDTAVRLADAAWEPLHHPAPLVSLMEDWDRLMQRFGARVGHPLADLIRLTGGQPGPE